MAYNSLGIGSKQNIPLLKEINLMTVFYIILKISGLLAIIIIPLIGPKKQKTAVKNTIGSLSVNEKGHLEHFTGNPVDHQSVH